MFLQKKFLKNKNWKKHKLETLIDEEALLLTKYLRAEKNYRTRIASFS